MAVNKKKVTDAARKAAAKGQYDKAIKEYSKLVKEAPSDTRTWMKIGDLYTKKGALKEAVETYQRVAEDYTEQGFYLKAIAVYKQTLKVDGSLIDINLKLAELYRQLGLLSDAMHHFDLVAEHFQREGKTEEALATIRQVVEIDPENISTRIKLAELYSKESMKDEAIVEFTKACVQLKEQSRDDDYIKVAERLLWHKPEDQETAQELARLYLQRNDARRALQKLQLCFQIDPQAIATLGLLADAFLALEQTEKTVSVLKELARVLADSGRGSEAEAAHRRILDISPQDQDSRGYLGLTATKSEPTPSVLPPEVTEGPAPKLIGRPTGSVPLLGDDGMPGVDDDEDDLLIADESYIDELALDDDEVLDAADLELLDDEELLEAGIELIEDDSDIAISFSDEDGAEIVDPGESEHNEFADIKTEIVDQEPALASPEEFEQSENSEIDKMLGDADVFIRYGLHPKAIAQLQQIFEIAPEHIAARELLRDVYLSQGRESEAIGEILVLAEQVLSTDEDRGAGYLREAIALDGACAKAFELANAYDIDLSGAPVAEISLDDAMTSAPAELSYEDDVEMVMPPLTGEGALPPFDPAAAAEFDKEAEIAHSSVDIPNPVEELSLDAPVDLESDVGKDEILEMSLDADVEAPRQENTEINVPVLGDGSAIVSENKDADLDLEFAHRADAQGTHSEQDISDELAEELEEADFFMAQGLAEEARDILEGLLEENPGHAAILSKLREVDEKVEDEVSEVSLVETKAKPAVMLEQALDDGDAETHYDLGLAYKEMGLFGEAISAFTKVAGTKGRRAQCHVMIGLCHREKGDLGEAVNQFKAGLYVEEITEDEKCSLYYEIGVTYEAQTDPDEAIYYFEMIAKKDPNYRDVSKRLTQLTSQATAGAQGTGASAANDMHIDQS